MTEKDLQQIERELEDETGCKWCYEDADKMFRERIVRLVAEVRRLQWAYEPTNEQQQAKLRLEYANQYGNPMISRRG